MGARRHHRGTGLPSAGTYRQPSVTLARPALRVDGQISLSGTRLWQGYGINYPAGVARIRDPFLYVGTRHDWRAPLKEALRIFHRVGARDKRTALYPGSNHGWDIIERSRFARQARTLVLQWIASRS